MGLLDGLLGGSNQQSASGMSPLTGWPIGVLAYPTYQGKGRLADMLGRTNANASPQSVPGQPGTVTPATGGLGDLLRGGLGSLLAGGAVGGAAGGLLGG